LGRGIAHIFAQGYSSTRGDEFWPPGVALGIEQIKGAAARNAQIMRASDSFQHD